jgi:hypothetical protein
VPAALLFGALGVTPLRSWDFWWHAAIGRLVDATGTVPTENLFLYTMEADHPSFIQPWLSQWALYVLEDALGLNAVLLLRNAAAGVAWAVLTWWAQRRAGSWQVAAVLALLVVPFGFLYIGARTHLLAWPLFLPCLALCYGVRSGRLSPFWLLALPGITALWVNLHGSFLIPSLIALAFLVDSGWQRLLGELEVPHGYWLIALVGSLGASVANPHGLEVWRYLVELSSNQVIQNTVTEWMPVTLGRPSFLGPLFYGLLLGGAALFGLGRSRFEAVDALLFFGFALMAALHARSLLWFALAVPVTLAPCASAVVDRWSAAADVDEPDPESRVSSLIHGTLIAAFVVSAVAVQPWTDDHELALSFRSDVRAKSPMIGLVPAEAPVDAIWLLKAAPTKRLRLFHDHRAPGFLIYHLQGVEPSQMVFVDNRVELPPAALWSEFERAGDAEDWRETFDEYDVNGAVLMHSTQGALVDEMEDSDQWRRLYNTDEYVVFLRRGFADTHPKR